ncbi:MAG TPA: antitoxin [Caulobacter sp.]|nr:antitoxin [Caulobacter sp.]
MAEPKGTIFDEFAEADASADAEGLADLDSGRSVPHEEVAAWLETWGTTGEKPPPKSWFR